MKKTTLIGICTATLMGIMTFNAKQKAIALEEQLTHLHHKIIALKESQHILKAEWSYLNEPSRLQNLAERHLKTHAGRNATQLVSLDDIIQIERIPYDGDAMVRLAHSVEKSHEKILR